MHAKNSTENQQMTDAVDEVDVGNSSWTEHLRRKEQDTLDRIIHGAETGHYYMILGSKVSPSSFPRVTRQFLLCAGDWKDDHDIGCNANQSGGWCCHV